MFKKIFNKNTENPNENEHILVTALLIHAAQIDEKYTKDEKEIIKKTLMRFFNKSEVDIEKILASAEQKEKDSNQIIEFTKKIKKNDMSYRLKIIEILWSIVYSDGVADMYESNLMRRVAGLLYVSDKDSNEIKEKIKKKNNNL